MVNLIHGDCLEVMKEMKDNSFDLILTDPPYGIFEAKKKTGFLRKNIKEELSNEANDWDKRPTIEYFKEMFRVSKNQIIFGLQYFIDYLPSTKEIIIWDKKNGKSYFADGEAAWTSFNGTLRIYRQMWAGYLREGTEDKFLEHPTQKPLLLFNWIIEKYTEKGQTVCDPFMGSGTTGVSCSKLGRHFTGIEIGEKYFNISKDRIKRENLQLKLF